MTIESTIIADTDTQNVAQTVYDITSKLTTPTPITLANGAQVVAVPEGIQLTSAKPFGDEYLTAPERRKGTANLYDQESFIAHVNRFKDDDSALFSSHVRTSPSITAVLNYHRRGAAGDPRYGDHIAFYPLPVSDEWTAWTKNNGKGMTQTDFAIFLEDRILDVIHIHDDAVLSERISNFRALINGSFASPTRLLELSKGLSITADEKVQNQINLQSGEAKLSYSSEHRDAAGEAISVPNMFMIAIPVFLNGTLYQIAVRLRYRLKQGQITWFYEMYQTDQVFDDAVAHVRTDVVEHTGLPLYVGTAEA
jgi:uncharacterized protein YfdQ (DUF2303 family)